MTESELNAESKSPDEMDDTKKFQEEVRADQERKNFLSWFQFLLNAFR